VIVNYRLGVFGFLCLNNVANLGLKDQVAALKWIQKNIAAFGGDPDNVTLSGQSAGASAAAMHMLSESSNGLFHKLILMSGSPLTPWAFNVEPQRPAFEDVRKVRNVSTEEDVYNYFATAPVTDILKICADTSLNPRYFKYSPCIDSNFTDPFFKDTPYDAIMAGRFSKVPILTGITSAEGILFYGLNDEESLRKLDDDFVDRLPSIFSWCSRADRKKIAKQIRQYYFGSRPIRKNLVQNVTNFYTDWLVNSTAEGFVELMLKKSDQPVYSYVFSYSGERNFAKAFFADEISTLEASHSDDIFYVFKPAGMSFILSNRDKLFIDRITTLFTNFMKFG
jgi:carboxylesterase type B